MQTHLHKINNFLKALHPDTTIYLGNISTRKTYKKGAFLLRENETCKHSFWVEKGIVRKFILLDGKEKTTDLLFENEIAVAFESYVLQKPGMENMQALTDTIVAQTEYHAFQQAKKIYPELIELDLLLTEYYTLWLEKRHFEWTTLDATGRYKLLLHEQPYVVQQVALTHIASFLGISLETLSRIRARR
jgi:CRP-like cAMP-binding protein